MRQNRVRELRETRGWSVRELAEKAGLSHGYVVRIENLERGLSVPIAEKLAKALEQPVGNVLGLSNTEPDKAVIRGFAEEAEPFAVDKSSPVVVRNQAKDHVYAYRVKGNTLNALRISAGDIVFVNISQEAVDAIKPLDCVLVQHYNAMAAVTLLRQFVPPSLLITNSTDTNERPLALDRDDIAIKGVIVGTYTTPYMRGG